MSRAALGLSLLALGWAPAAAAAPVASVAAPAGGLCGSGKRAKDCWKGGGKRQSLVDPPAATDGLRRLALRSSKLGARSARLRASGADLALPALPLLEPASVQLVGNRGACWSSAFTAPARESSATEFSDTAD